MSKDKRESMINILNPQPIIEENIKESEEEVIEEKKVNPLIEKFNQSFFKIHLRYPTDEEVKASLGSLYHEDDNNEHTVININETPA
jgi:hypothetical protein